MRSNFLYRSLLLLSLLFVGVSLTYTAEITPAMQQMINAELQKRNLTESEARAGLLKEGIDLESVPKTELPQYQTRVIAVLDKLEAEKKAKTKAAITGDQLNAPTVVVVNTPDASSSKNKTDDKSSTSKSERVSESSTISEVISDSINKKVSEKLEQITAPVNIYGHNLLKDKVLGIFRTADGAQAPDTYVLGEGDEVHITIFGASQTDIQQRVAADGSIHPAGVAKIFVKGLNLAQAREVIKKFLSSSYLFRTDQVAVTIVTARTIMVNMFGEVKVSGGFTMSALNSAINALSLAGGTTDLGSVRAIQLIRGNVRKTIDLYAFMNDPTVQYKYDLQNNDIIFVPVIQKLVSVEGAVNRPMAYEMLQNETLTDLINFAGGLKGDVYPNFVQVKRFVDGQERLLEWDLKEVLRGNVKVTLVNGDVVRVKSIGKPMDQFVEVGGSVYYPGKYDLSVNSSLKTVLASAKPTIDAKIDLVFVERTRQDNTLEQISVKWTELQKKGQDFKLEAKDRVRIPSLTSFRDVASISVQGYVRKPFTKTFSLSDKITVKQALEMADGLRVSTYPVAYVFRKNINNRVETQYIRIELNKSDEFLLQPGDELNVYDNSTYMNVGELKIVGAVKQTKAFTFDSSMSVRDLITNAGGFTVGAAYNRVEVFRTILSPTEPIKFKTIILTVDSNFNVLAPEYFKLQPYDQVVVRLTPEFSLGRTVEINGQVKYPGVYLLDSKQMQLNDLVKMAGGLLNDADANGATLFRTYNNRGNITMNIKQATRHAHSYAKNPILFEGDVINVNRLENTVSIRELGTRMAQYQLDSTKHANKYIIYQGRKSAAWYVRNFAGGFQKHADKNSVTVTYANNEQQSTRHFLFFRIYPKVVPGSTVSLVMNQEEIKKTLEPKEKITLENALSKSITTLSSTLSMILLLQRL